MEASGEYSSENHAYLADDEHGIVLQRGTYSKDIVVAAGLSVFRTGVDEGFITPSGTDLDVFVFRSGAQVGAAADGDSNEMVTFNNPVAGTYTVYVHGFSTNGDYLAFLEQTTSIRTQRSWK